MECLSFRLDGKTAFFKKPDVNSNIYFTYGCIHKVALMGLLGAILGYSGYNQMDKSKDEFPEFYDKLQNLNVSIEPLCENGAISKKIQKFNNSVGYASQEQGGNLIVSEQWLENPAWRIYILIDSEESIKLKESIINKRSKYIPYLGKNDHYANITEAEVSNLEVCCIDNNIMINSIVSNDDFEISSDYDEEEFEACGYSAFKYQEKLPVSLNSITNLYDFKTFFYTNLPISKLEGKNVYSLKGRNIVFY